MPSGWMESSEPAMSLCRRCGCSPRTIGSFAPCRMSVGQRTSKRCAVRANTTQHGNALRHPNHYQFSSPSSKHLNTAVQQGLRCEDAMRKGLQLCRGAHFRRGLLAHVPALLLLNARPPRAARDRRHRRSRRDHALDRTSQNAVTKHCESCNADSLQTIAAPSVRCQTGRGWRRTGVPRRVRVARLGPHGLQVVHAAVDRRQALEHLLAPPRAHVAGLLERRHLGPPSGCVEGRASLELQRAS